MSEVYIVVEGPTERTFVESVLAPYLANKGIYLHASVIGVPGHKGGDIRFDRAYRDIQSYLKTRKDTYVSSMFDYFRISNEWPGVVELKKKLQTGLKMSALEKGTDLEDATLKAVQENYPDHNNRFIPYIEMHEFEALLFSDAAILSSTINVHNDIIDNILKDYDSPEDINSDPQKAPSKRLESLNEEYKKVIMGKVISEKIGISKIREKCQHFNNWIARLESL